MTAPVLGTWWRYDGPGGNRGDVMRAVAVFREEGEWSAILVGTRAAWLGSLMDFRAQFHRAEPGFVPAMEETA